MRSLINQVKKVSLKSKALGHSNEFLDYSFQEQMCQQVIKKMQELDLKKLGIEGYSAQEDHYHFKSQLNRVTVEANDDYRLVMFFIKKGTEMPLHDHPNMSVFFKLMFGQLQYTSYDKLDSKFKYNQLSSDEYDELIFTKALVEAKKSKERIIQKDNILVVKPSSGNMHKFIALEDSCFFDICLPNYSNQTLRKITYFNEIENKDDERVKNKKNVVLQYNTTPPNLPVGFHVEDINYRGDLSYN